MHHSFEKRETLFVMLTELFKRFACLIHEVSSVCLVLPLTFRVLQCCGDTACANIRRQSTISSWLGCGRSVLVSAGVWWLRTTWVVSAPLTVVRGARCSREEGGGVYGVCLLEREGGRDAVLSCLVSVISTVNWRLLYLSVLCQLLQADMYCSQSSVVLYFYIGVPVHRFSHFYPNLHSSDYTATWCSKTHFTYHLSLFFSLFGASINSRFSFVWLVNFFFYSLVSNATTSHPLH